jgi:8-amino-7-oxononanoate synthase
MNSNTHAALAWVDEQLASLDRKSLRRRLATREGKQAARIVLEGTELVSFGSNDYLGLAADPRLVGAMASAAAEGGWGSGASPLVTGHGRAHQRLEEGLAEFEGTEAALLFSTGFAANAGTIAALAGPGDVVFTDRKNHASIWDGCRLSRADVRPYRHVDTRHLARLLDKSGRYRRRLIVTDSLFSMDGDLAPLAELCRLAEQYDAMLMIDEAHATGVFGPRGRGVAEQLGVEGRVHVRVGTLSKALGSIGGFVASSRSLVDWLLNRARPYVFSTALPAPAAAAATAALAIVREAPARGRELLSRAAALRARLAEQGWDVGGSQSQIIPVIVREPDRAMRLAAALRERGLFVPAIRPPTVPDGETCLRISLTYGHAPEMIDQLAGALGELR